MVARTLAFAKTFVSRWIWKTLIALFVLGMTSSISSIIYGLYIEQPYLEYMGGSLPVVIQPLHPGDIIPIRATRCNHDGKPHIYTVTRTLINVENGDYNLMPEVTVYLPAGCTTNVSMVHRLPSELPPGRYRIHGSAEIVGRIRIFKVDWHTDIFEVTK